jgi:ribosome hibernation promoting factor
MFRQPLFALAGGTDMRMEIRGRNLWLTPALLDHVERRVRDALGRYRARVRRVTVRLFDANGDRGGIDKQCRIVVQTVPGNAIVVEDIDTDLYAAVTRAASRAAEGLRRRLERIRSARTGAASLRG